MMNSAFRPRVRAELLLDWRGRLKDGGEDARGYCDPIVSVQCGRLL